MTARTLLALAAALAAALPALPQQETPKKDAPPPQEPAKKDSMELKLTATPGKGRPSLKLEGLAPTLPEGTRLNMLLMRIEERTGGETLTTAGALYHTEIVRVENKGRFVYISPPGSPPGYYRAAVRLMEETQYPRILANLKEDKKLMPQEWLFDYTAWGDDLAGRLSPVLLELDGIITQSKGLVGRYAQYAANQALWEANVKAGSALDREATKLMQELEKSEAKRLYPAACNDISTSISAVQANALFVKYKDGQAEMVDYHTGKKPVTHKQEEFSWDVMQKYLDEAAEVAGREFSLWVVKDARRAGKVSDALAKAVKDRADHPGVSLYVNRLQQGERLDEIEKTIRQKPAK